MIWGGAKGRVGATVVAAALCLAAPRVGAQEASPPEARHATLKIDTSKVGDAGPIVKRRVEERGTIVLRDASILPARDARDDALITVVVEEMRGDEPGFVFELSVEQGGELVGERRRVECTLCTESEIVERIERELATATTLVQASVAEAEADGPSEGGEGTQDVAPGADDAAAEDGEVDGGQGLGAKGKAGVGLLAVGGAALATGLGLALAPAKVDESNPLQERSTRLPGYGVLAGAGVALVVGGVLLGLDRREARSRTVAWSPWLGRGLAGASVTARF